MTKLVSVLLVFTVIVMQYGLELEAQERLYGEGILMSYALILFIPIYAMWIYLQSIEPGPVAAE